MQFDGRFDYEASVNAVKHIFISQMKSSGIECSPVRQQQGQHEFLFSLRSLRPQAKPRFDINLDFAPQNIASDCASKDQTSANKISFKPSDLLPCFSKGSQPAFAAFCTVSDISAFQSWSKKTISNLALNVPHLKQERQQITMAKPNCTYCQICRETFSDYLKHLEHPSHVRKFQKQRKNKMIDDLLKDIESESQSTRRDRCIRMEDDEDFVNTPCKIRVIQQQDTLTPMRVNSSHLEVEKKRGSAIARACQQKI